MGTRAVRLTALLAATAALAACTSPPEPPMGSPAPKLDPQAIAYDNLDFNRSRNEVFDNTCETLPQNLSTLLGLQGKPFTPSGGGCHSKESWGGLTIQLFSPRALRKSQAQYFSDAWNSDLGRAGYFQRSILLERYYAVTQISGSVNEYCTITVDTGSEQPFEVQASMDLNESSALLKQDVDQPIDRAMRDFCPRAKDAAEKILPLIDKDGGSRAR